MTLIHKLWAHAKDIVRDYRYKVHENAGICFAYYLIMSIFPICSLLSFFAAVFNVDLSIMTKILEKFLTPEFSKFVVAAIVSTDTSATSLIVIGISTFVVSRGIHQLYGISKNMFPPVHDRTNVIEQVFTILKTLTVFILLLVIIAILTFFPIILSSIETNQDTVASLMKKLKNPPEEYEDAYDAIKELYDAYTKLTNLATSPSGSLQTYSENFNAADTEVVNCYEAMQMYID